MAKAQAKELTQVDVTLIATSVRDGFHAEGAKAPILSLKTDEQRVMKAAKAGGLRLVRNLNQHVARYAITDGKRELTFKAQRV